MEMLQPPSELLPTEEENRQSGHGASLPRKDRTPSKCRLSLFALLLTDIKMPHTYLIIIWTGKLITLLRFKTRDFSLGMLWR
jgi:hypothetical protein